MDVKYIEHIGVAVKNLNESIPLFEKLLGVKCYAQEDVLDQSVRTAFFKVGQTKIELLESTDEAGPIASFINKKGEGVHHLAFAVDSTNKALKEAKEQGFRLIDYEARRGAEGLDIGFLNPKKTNGILVEFCSSDSHD